MQLGVSSYTGLCVALPRRCPCASEPQPPFGRTHTSRLCFWKGTPQKRIQAEVPTGLSEGQRRPCWTFGRAPLPVTSKQRSPLDTLQVQLLPELTGTKPVHFVWRRVAAQGGSAATPVHAMHPCTPCTHARHAPMHAMVEQLRRRRPPWCQQAHTCTRKHGS